MAQWKLPAVLLILGLAGVTALLGHALFEVHGRGYPSSIIHYLWLFLFLLFVVTAGAGIGMAGRIAVKLAKNRSADALPSRDELVLLITCVLSAAAAGIGVLWIQQ